MAAAGDVGVGQFVHQRQSGFTFQNGVKIHFVQQNAAMVNAPPRDDFQARQQGVRFLATVGFDISDGDVASLGLARLGLPQHGVGLADARAHSEKYLQSSATDSTRLRLLGGGKQKIRIESSLIIHCGLEHTYSARN